MSVEPESPLPSPPRPESPPQSLPEGDVDETRPRNLTVRDVVMWRRKKVAAALLVVATAMWTILQVYRFNFVTVVSWVAMFVVTLVFFWGNLQRLFNKEAPQMSGLEISEQKAVEMTYMIQTCMEKGVRWMFRVGAEGHPFSFAGTLAALWVASKVSGCFDFLTFAYIGIVLGMTLPPIYVKYEDRIEAIGERSRVQCKRLYSWVDEKALRKIKDKVAGDKKEKKEKKIE